MNVSKFVASMLIGLPLFLSACGGGGNGDVGGNAGPPPAPPQPPAEGVFGGTLALRSATHFQALILENGEFWSIYGRDYGSIFQVDGFVQGSGTSNNGSFTSPNVKDFGIFPPLPGTLYATYNSSARTMAGTVTYTYTTGTAQFNGGPIAGSLYNYAVAPSMSTIAGSWATMDPDGGSVSVLISSNGAVMTVDGVCESTGTITPRPSGKNVFNVTLNVGTLGCRMPGATATGIAVAYPLSTGQTQLIAAVMNETRTEGIVVFGIR